MIRHFSNTVLLASLSFLGTACHGHRASHTQIDDPGTHVVSHANATSVIWSDGKTERVCTVPRSGKSAHSPHHGKRGWGHAPSPGGKGSSDLDATLFRLCEARGNGDLTAAEYTAALKEVVASAGKGSCGCPHCAKMKGMGMKGMGMGKDGRPPHSPLSPSPLSPSPTPPPGGGLPTPGPDGVDHDAHH